MWKNIGMVRRRAVVALIACLAVALLAGAVPAAAAPAAMEAQVPGQAPAVAAVSCNYIVLCDGVEPNGAVYEDANGGAHLCKNDARTIYDSHDWGSLGGYVELRYSRKCRIAWARGSGAIYVEAFNADGSTRVSFPAATYAGVYQVHTLAVNDAGLLARACVWPNNSGPEGPPVCGPKY